MSKFVALFNKSGESVSDELMTRHVEHLRNLRKQGKLVLCGPLKDSNEVLQILSAENCEEAHRLALDDPFTEEGFFSDCSLHELVEATEENNYLLKK
jgi:uncharacterized protein YciI